MKPEVGTSMTLKEARRLADEYDAWVYDKVEPAWVRKVCRGKPKGTLVREVDRRKVIRANLQRHCMKYFDKVVGALELVRGMHGHHLDAEWAMVDYILKEAKEVL